MDEPQTPPVDAPADPLAPPAVVSKPIAFWKQQIDQARQARAPHERWWDANLKAYAPRATDDPDNYGTCINTNRTFTTVERKKADMFYQRPEVTLIPSPLLDGPILSEQIDPTTGQNLPLMGPPNAQGQAVPIPATHALQAHEEIVNEKLGADAVDAVRMAHAAIFDVEMFGTGWTKMGYESTTVAQETIDPLTGEAVSVPVPIAEHCFWHHFGPKQALAPADFRSTDWDKAPWLGYEFELPLTPANREKYNLPADFQGSSSEGKLYLDHGQGTPTLTERVFTGVEIWYRSALYRDDVRHPDHLTQLVIVHGVDEPVIEKDSPYQTIDERGGLTPDSLIGYPIHPLNVRAITDSAYPQSDATLIRPLENELNRFREQMVEYRDAQTLRWQYNMDTLPQEAVQKIVRSPIGGMIGVPSEAFAGEGAIKELPHGSMPRESFTSNDYIDNDIARTTAIDASGAGVQSSGSTTATEQQIISANANARLDFERGLVLQWYIRGVTKFSTLLQRYLSVQDAAKIVGPQRAQVWDVWRKQIASPLAFTAQPDSALRVDQAVDRKQAQELYSFLANDPFIAKGRAKLLEKLLRKYHIDPSGIVAPPDPPQPEQPKVNLSFKGEDLVAAQGPIVVEILQQLGLKISPQAVQLSQQMALQAQQLAEAQAQEEAMAKQAGDTKHGGKLAQQESLSKHAADKTGGMQNTGAPAALGAAGGKL